MDSNFIPSPTRGPQQQASSPATLSSSTDPSTAAATGAINELDPNTAYNQHTTDPSVFTPYDGAHTPTRSKSQLNTSNGDNCYDPTSTQFAFPVKSLISL